jgi:hypothetical protein
VIPVLNFAMTETRTHAVATCSLQSKAAWTVSGRTAIVAVTAAPAKGTGMSAARTRTAAPQLIASLPFSAVVVTDVNAGIRSWSPPV